jgi:aminopeptidase N
METVSGQDLSWFFKQWIYQTGQPELDIDWDYKPIGKKLEIYVNQKQKNEALFRSTLELSIYYKGKKEPDIKKLNLDNKESAFTLKLEKAPESVVIDPNIWLLMRASYGTK